MLRCGAIKGNGKVCRGIAATGSNYCPAHDPNRKEARRRAASKAAKSKRGKGVIDVLYDQARKLYEGVERGDIDPKVGTVLVQAVNAQTRILELQRRVEFADAITHEEMRWIIQVIYETSARHINDRETLDAICRDLEKYLEEHR